MGRRLEAALRALARYSAFRFTIEWTLDTGIPNCRLIARKPMSCFLSAMTSPARTAMPIITVQPQSEVAIVSSNVEFQESAAGAPPLAYQWQFFGTNFPNATNATLSLTNVTSDQAGPYQVIVTNSVGSVTSDVAQLTVYLTAAAELTLPTFSTNQFQFTDTNVHARRFYRALYAPGESD